MPLPFFTSPALSSGYYHLLSELFCKWFVYFQTIIFIIVRVVFQNPKLIASLQCLTPFNGLPPLLHETKFLKMPAVLPEFSPFPTQQPQLLLPIFSAIQRQRSFFRTLALCRWKALFTLFSPPETLFLIYALWSINCLPILTQHETSSAWHRAEYIEDTP